MPDAVQRLLPELPQVGVEPPVPEHEVPYPTQLSDLGGSTDPLASLSVALPGWQDLLAKQLAPQMDAGVATAAPAGESPAPASRQESTTPETVPSDPPPYRTLLPYITKNDDGGRVLISPENGGTVASPDGRAAVSFAPGGLPGTIVAYYVKDVAAELPLHLYPFGPVFAVQARWLDGGQPVTNLDPEAIPVPGPGGGKPLPVEPRYWATVSFHLSSQEFALLDPEWVGIARQDPSSGQWILLNAELNRSTAAITAQTSRLGTFALVQNMPNNPPVGPLDVIVDDLDPGFQKFQDPRIPPDQGEFWWPVNCASVPCYDGHAWYTWNRSSYEDLWLPPGERCNWATWTPALTQTGYYLVSVFVPGLTPPTAGADYEIHHNGTVDTVSISQAANPGTFVNLGAFQFTTGGGEHLYLDDVVAETQPKGSQEAFDVAIFTFGGEAPPSPEEIAALFALGVRRWQKYVGDPVSSSTGNHVQQIEIVRLPFRDEFETNLTLYYNSLGEDAGLFGSRWTSVLDMRLKRYYDKSVMIWMPDGQALYWQYQGGSYVPWDGVQGKLEADGNGWRLTMPDQAAYLFQPVGWQGRLVRVEDRHGNGARLLYDGDGRVQAFTDDAGRSLTFTYNGDMISEVHDPLDRTWAFTYDGENLASVRNANGGTTHYTYTGDGYLKTMTDPKEILYLRNVYDGQGRVVEQYDAAGSRSTWTYDDGSQTVTFADNLQHPTVYRYDDQHRLVEEKDLWGKTIAYEYDEDYNLTARVDKMGHRWEYTYDDRGNLLTESGPLDWYVEYTYNDTNDLTSVADPVRGTTEYVWENGNLVRVERPDDTAIRHSYDSYGQVRSTSDPLGHTTTYTYAEYGDLETVRTPLGCVTHYEYDMAGRMTVMTDGNGHTMRTTYDNNDNVLQILDPRQHPTDFEYDANDSLIKMIDRRRGEWAYRYDDNLKLIGETDPEKHETTYTYDLMYNRLTATDALTHTTWYAYDELYRLVSVEDALHNVTRYEYDADDNLTFVYDALDGTTEMRYDDLHRLELTIDALGGETEYYYDRVSRLVRLVNPREALARYEYDALDRLIHTWDAYEGQTDYGYDDDGHLIAVTDANRHTTTYGYDDDHRMISKTDPEGHVTKYKYDCVGNLIKLVDARTNPTRFEYDENDNLTLVVDALLGETRYTYDEEDARLTATDPNHNTTTFVYNLDGLLKTLIEAGEQRTEFEYDPAHNLNVLTNAKGNASRFEYDELNRLVRAYDPLTHLTEYSYDELSRLTSVTDANRVATGYEYDALDRLTAVVQNQQPGQPADHQTNVRTEYTYDEVGNLKAIDDANRHVTTFDYDLLDRLIREVNPLGETWRYEYDPVGNLTRRIDANGAVTDYRYDKDDLLVATIYPSGPGITYTYDATHNQVRMVDSLGLTANTYDALNRLTSSTNHLGQVVRYGYDPASNRTSLTYPDARVLRLEYDANNRVQRVVDPDGNAFQLTYDPTHNITRILYPNLTQALLEYDDADRLVSLVNEQLDGDPISTFAYTMDPVGNRTHSDEFYRWRQPNELSHDYQYDPLYRLTRSDDSEGRWTEYTYDAVGNRLGQASNYDPLRTPTDVDPYTVAYTFNEANQLRTTNHSEFGVTEYTYDHNGNRVQRLGPDVWIGNPNDQLRTDYTYDYENRLTWTGNFFDPGNGNWLVRDESAMSYDGYGRLFNRMHDQHQSAGGQKWTQFVYDGLDPIVEYVDPSPQYTNYYRAVGRILEMHDYKSQQSPAGTAYYFHHDGLGSVSAITKHRGQSAHNYRYGDYGVILDKNDGAADSSAFTNPHNHYTYTGQEWEEYTRLYHFYAREYDPITGTWLQPDPYRGRLMSPPTAHRYGYVEGSPISYVDLYGFSRDWVQKWLANLPLMGFTQDEVFRLLDRLPAEFLWSNPKFLAAWKKLDLGVGVLDLLLKGLEITATYGGYHANFIKWNVNLLDEFPLKISRLLNKNGQLMGVIKDSELGRLARKTGNFRDSLGAISVGITAAPEFWKAGTNIGHVWLDDSMDPIEQIALTLGEVGTASLRTLAKLPTGTVTAASWLVDKSKYLTKDPQVKSFIESSTAQVTNWMEKAEQWVDETVTSENVYNFGMQFNDNPVTYWLADQMIERGWDKKFMKQ